MITSIHTLIYSPRHQEMALMCDDIEATRTELERKGATFSAPVTDEG